MRIPGNVRRSLEHLFRADLGAIRVSETRELPANAAAVTRGTAVAFARGLWQPESARCRAILAHEIAHSFQQQRHGLTGGALVVDPRLEAEADAWACLALLDPALLDAFPFRPQATLAPRADGVVQPWILMAKTDDNPFKYGSKDYTPSLTYKGFFNPPDQNRGKPLDDKFTKLDNMSVAMRGVNAAYQFLFERTPDKTIFVILLEWMGITSKRAEMRYYHTFGELAWALERERETRQALLQENAVAQMVLESHVVRMHLQLLAKKVAALIEKNQEKIPLSEKAAYGPLHGHPTFGDVYLALENGWSLLGTERLIALLHDAKDACAKAALFDTSEPSFDLHVSSVKTLTISKNTMRYNVGTVDEADPWTIWMREKSRAVWAGPSYTMLHMWTMAEAAGATSDELTAMGFAMFAYWNQCYPHTATPIHRFHETFSAAHKFGLEYHPSLGVLANWAIFVGKFTQRPKL